MATATEQNIPVLKHRSLEFENNAFVADGPIVFPAVEAYCPPRPIADARGSKSNEELAKIAERRQPPLSWYDVDEEQLF